MSEHKLNLTDAVRNTNRRRYLANKKLKLPEPQMYITPKQSQEKHKLKIIALQQGKKDEQKQI